MIIIVKRDCSKPNINVVNNNNNNNNNNSKKRLQ